jgi:predicted ATP-grasp superfamily ATP-dependent carboligase
MRVAIYEWCMSGGLAGGTAAIAREGRMMLEALAADAAGDPALEVDVLVEEGRDLDRPARGRVVPVPVGDDVPALVAAARAADWTVIVAPETDGILAALVASVREAGGRVVAPARRVIEIAADKQATIDALAARGVSVPAGRPLAAGEPVPPGFRMPAVRKRRASCGGDGLEVLATHDAAPDALPTRIEAFAAGMPVGVSCICGTRSPIVLPPLRQVFTAGRSPRYLGGDVLADEPLAARATDLARRAAAAVGADAGWLGIDMILGRRPDGRDDRVLEVNPRITTSFVGLARLFSSSLVATMIGAAAGAEEPLAPVPHPAPAGAGFRVPGG